MATGKFNYVWNYLSSTIDDFKAIILGYRTYKAFLTQMGEDTPVATVVDNTLGINITYEYDGSGYYYALLNRDLFDGPDITISGQKVEVTITPSSSIVGGDSVLISAYPVFFFVIAIESQVDGAGEDNVLGTAFSSVLEIKVYNK